MHWWDEGASLAEIGSFDVYVDLVLVPPPFSRSVRISKMFWCKLQRNGMNEMYLRRKEAMLHPVSKKNITSLFGQIPLRQVLMLLPITLRVSLRAVFFPTLIAFREKREKSSTDVVSGVPRPSMYEQRYPPFWTVMRQSTQFACVFAFGFATFLLDYKRMSAEGNSLRGPGPGQSFNSFIGWESLEPVKPIAAALVTLATSVDHGFSIPPQNSLRGPYFYFTTFFSSNADSPF